MVDYFGIFSAGGEILAVRSTVWAYLGRLFRIGEITLTGGTYVSGVKVEASITDIIREFASV